MLKANETSNFTRLRCQRCKKIWDYHGNNPYVASCPHCCTRVSIKKNKLHTGSSFARPDQYVAAEAAKP
jgi:DNA-directed RNA polymerase subunit RPC12/RpoP